MTAIIRHKRGDTFDWSGQLTTEGALSFVGWQIKSQARAPGGAVLCQFEATWLSPADRTFRLRKTGTEGWQLGEYKVDIQLTTPEGDIVSTPTFVLAVDEDVTI